MAKLGTTMQQTRYMLAMARSTGRDELSQSYLEGALDARRAGAEGVRPTLLLDGLRAGAEKGFLDARRAKHLRAVTNSGCAVSRDPTPWKVLQDAMRRQ